MSTVFFIIIAVELVKKHNEEEPKLGISFDGYKTESLTLSEKEQIYNVALTAENIKYTWGGQTLKDGFDCSGLIVWAYGKLGFTSYRHEDRLLTDVNANSLYLYNSTELPPEKTVKDIEVGDWIFFDTDKDGLMEHVSIFSHVDDKGGVWVIDAYSVVGSVSVRKVEDYSEKNPRLASPKRVFTI